MIALYDFDLSASCYKARLMCALLGVEYERRNVEVYPGRAHEGPAFLQVNPLGTVPVLVTDAMKLIEPNAILAWLASAHDPAGQWFPRDPALAGEVQQWLSIADRLGDTAGAARLGAALEFDVDLDAARAGAHRLFDLLDEHLWFRELRGGAWLADAEHPTIADIACFPDVILSEEGGVSRADYPALRRWCDRVKRIPNFVVMPGVFPAEVGSQ